MLIFYKFLYRPGNAILNMVLIITFASLLRLNNLLLRKKLIPNKPDFETWALSISKRQMSEGSFFFSVSASLSFCSVNGDCYKFSGDWCFDLHFPLGLGLLPQSFLQRYNASLWCSQRNWPSRQLIPGLLKSVELW